MEKGPDYYPEALGLATEPYFSVEIDLHVNTEEFHENSPAGLFLKNHDLNFKFSKFINPYQVGGFGASTAEFILSYFQTQNLELKNTTKKANNKELIEKIFHEYVNLNSSHFHLDVSIKQENRKQEHKKQGPSGADLITQLLGQVTHFKFSQREAKLKEDKPNCFLEPRTLSWPFKDLDFLIYSTGLKIKTHEHLSNLNFEICKKLVKPSQVTAQAFLTGDSQIFKQELKSWSTHLVNYNLQHAYVLELKSYLENQLVQDILVKPCGALGADVILILCKTDEKEVIKRKIEDLKEQNSNLKKVEIQNLTYKADSLALSFGPLAFTLNQ